MRTSTTARAASINAYDRWKAARQDYERLLEAFGDERLVAEIVTRGRHLNLCAKVAISSERAEAARRHLAGLLDTRDCESGSPVVKRVGANRTDVESR